SLIPLSRGSFDVIVGIDWLSKRKFVIVCHEKMVEIPLEGSRKLRVQGERTLGAAKALMNAKVDEPKVGDISVVMDFGDVFPEDLPGLPPQRQVEFRIDLVHEATLVAKSPYRLAPLEMQELSKQLRELQDKELLRKEKLYAKFTKSEAVKNWEEKELILLMVKAADLEIRSTSGIRACALRNFDLGTMELENSQNNALAKLPMLKLGEYEMWEIRIKQYFQIQDYALWEVIENGNSWVPIPVTAPESGPSTALKMIVPSTTEEKICKKNDVKARSLLLMALPNEHQLTFNQYVDAQSMFAAIKARFRGNEATKRTQKALLKQQYENFNASSSESLDSIFNRLQKLVSRLAILGVVTPPEDLNVKFLRSLPSEWDTHVVVWMNKPDFDTMGLDDLYNNFKIVENKSLRRTLLCYQWMKRTCISNQSGASHYYNNTVNLEVSTGTTKVNTASTEN
ncbi:hypothetical protein Tco_0930411, partial [Tanacetum coccineum]